MTAPRTAQVVVCGAGIAGVAVAYHLAVRRGARGVVLIDEREPLTLTSAKGTGGYRNWWPGPDGAMVRFMNRSIALMEELAHESGDAFRMRRCGYAFLTAEERGVAKMRREAALVSSLGAGEVREGREGDELDGAGVAREHREGDSLDGADLVFDPTHIRSLLPGASPDALAMLHVRRAGTFDPRALGAWLLGRVDRAGVPIVRDRLDGVELAAGRVGAARLRSGERIETDALILAPGPHLARTGRAIGFEMPVLLELHGKIIFDDPLGVVPEEAPLLIWSDSVRLEWSAQERARLAAQGESRLLEPFPGGVHVRPSGAAGDRTLQIIWTYDTTPREMIWPPSHDPHYGEILIRGLARMLPAFSAYFGQGARARVDGGYYCKAPDNRPIIGPLPLQGAFIAGALSGFGVMASQAAAELVAAHLLGEPLPDYAPAFRYGRHDEPEYQQLMSGWDATAGQL